jgi:hypothetical protein
MPALIGGLGTPFWSARNWSPKSMKAEVALLPKLEIEQAAVESQSLFESPTSSATWLKPTARAFLASAMALSVSS